MTQVQEYTTVRIRVEDMRRLKVLAARERRSVLQQLARLIDEVEAKTGEIAQPTTPPQEPQK